MRKRKFFFKILFIIACFVSVWRNFLLGNEWQLWQSASMKAYIAKDIKVGLAHQCRFYDTLSTLDFFESSQDISFRIKGSNFFGFGLANCFFKEDYSRWIGEFYFSVFIKNKFKIFGLGLNSTIMTAYRAIEDSDNRGYLQIKLSVDLLKLKNVTIYANNKFYYNYNNLGQYDRNRTTVGVTRKLFEKLDMGAYFMLQKNKSRIGSSWGTINVVGLDLMFNF